MNTSWTTVVLKRTSYAHVELAGDISMLCHDNVRAGESNPDLNVKYMQITHRP